MAKELGRFVWYKPESIGYFTKCTPRSEVKHDRNESDNLYACYIAKYGNGFSICSRHCVNYLYEAQICMEI